MLPMAEARVPTAAVAPAWYSRVTVKSIAPGFTGTDRPAVVLARIQGEVPPTRPATVIDVTVTTPLDGACVVEELRAQAKDKVSVSTWPSLPWYVTATVPAVMAVVPVPTSIFT